MRTVASKSPVRSLAEKPLPFEPDLLALGKPGRDSYLDLLAGRQLHALLGALGGFGERDGERGDDVAAAGRKILLLEMNTRARTSAAGPAQSAQDVLENVL